MDGLKEAMQKAKVLAPGEYRGLYSQPTIEAELFNQKQDNTQFPRPETPVQGQSFLQTLMQTLMGKPSEATPRYNGLTEEQDPTNPYKAAYPKDSLIR